MIEGGMVQLAQSNAIRHYRFVRRIGVCKNMCSVKQLIMLQAICRGLKISWGETRGVRSPL